MSAADPIARLRELAVIGRTPSRDLTEKQRDVWIDYSSSTPSRYIATAAQIDALADWLETAP